MRVSHVLQLSTLLVGLCHVWGAPPLGRVPLSQVRMLSHSLSRLLQGVSGNAERLEQQGGAVAAETDRATKSLESVHGESTHAGRTHKQVRKDLQIQSARRDRLWRLVMDLQRDSEDLETEQAAMRRRMNRILQSMKRLSETRSGGRAHTGIGSMKALVDKRARWLDTLTSEVSARERTISRCLQHIEHLEKLLSSGA